MTRAILARAPNGFEASEKRLYGGCTVELSDEVDRFGARLVRLLDGELAGACIWVTEGQIAEVVGDEINRESPGKTIDVSSAEEYHGAN
jgi:hypothetical protein